MDRGIGSSLRPLDYQLLREPDWNWAILVPQGGSVGPRLAIKLRTSEAENHQRHRLDLIAADQKFEIERLPGLGARRVDWRSADGTDSPS